MAIRLRKLAGEFGLPTEVVVERLRGLGHDRYRGDADQVPDDVAERVRKVLKKEASAGGTAPSLAAIPRAPRNQAAPQDVMAQLVPGVRPVARDVDPRFAEREAELVRRERALEVQRALPPPPPPSPPGRPLEALLGDLAVEARPAALARLARALGPRLGSALWVVDEDAVRAALAPPAAVAVDDGDPREDVEALCDALLLHGRRRVVVLGGRAEQHQLVRRLADRRIQWDGRPLARDVVLESVVIDLDPVDMGVVWALEGRPPGPFVHVANPSIAGLCAAIREALRGD